MQIYSDLSLKWIRSTWIPWKHRNDLQGLLDSVLDTFLYYLPCPRFTKLFSEYESNIQDIHNAIKMICKDTDQKVELPRTVAQSGMYLESIFPAVKILRHSDPIVVCCMLLLYLENPKQACRIPLKTAMSPNFVEVSCKLLGIKSTTEFKDRLELKVFKKEYLLQFTEQQGLHYVPFVYFKNVLNVDTHDIQYVENLLDTCHEETRISKEELIKTCFVSNCPSETDGLYKITFK